MTQISPEALAAARRKVTQDELKDAKKCLREFAADAASKATLLASSASKPPSDFQGMAAADLLLYAENVKHYQQRIVELTRRLEQP